ncbi:hypothetical protein G5I_01620 [Acromyrmex echinatior]|uniref:Uncharacterized protein n=1 Tax=Acromyrmex echinatior TaxID=103372 RepID=F4W843_ACREC|nr:hypothetical protein G5I_01620 [Acromyrmex echinatior]
MKPMFQHYHGDGTSFLRGPAHSPVVRNSSVVLIMLIKGQQSARLKGLLSFGGSLADGLVVSAIEKQIFVLLHILYASISNITIVNQISNPYMD